MSVTEAPPELDEVVENGTTDVVTEPTTTPSRPEPTTAEIVLGATDHHVIGRLFVGFSLAFLAFHLVIAALSNVQLAADGDFLDSGIAGRFALNSPLGLLLSGVLPLFVGLGIIVVPRQLGSPAISFARGAALSFWLWALSSIIFIISLLADGSYGGQNTELARLGNVAVGGLLVSLCIGIVCIAVTVLCLRPAGMGLAEVPFFSWSMLVAATVWITTLPSVLSHVVLGHIVKPTPTDLAETTYRGMGWLLSQPSVYVALIPVLGFAADAVATSVGGRQRFRGAVHGLIALAGLLSFGAWAQTAESRETFIWVAVTAAFALPLLGLLGALADTVRAGKPKLVSPLIFAVLSLLVALLAALTGLLQSIDTAGSGQLVGFESGSLALGQLYLVVGVAVIGGLGGATYWAMQTWGNPLPDTVGKGIATLAALGAVLLGVPLVIRGLLFANDSGISTAPFAGAAAAGAALLALAVLALLGAGMKARSETGRGDELLPDPWGGAGTLEWASDAVRARTVESAYPVLDAAEETPR